jgi:hypothetical protein
MRLQANSQPDIPSKIVSTLLEILDLELTGELEKLGYCFNPS